MFSLLVWLPVLFIGVLMVSGYLVATGKRRRREEVARLGDVRRGGSFATFAADFPPDYSAPEILRAVYGRFQQAAASHQGVDGVVVRADDGLEAIYDAYLVSDYNDFDELDLREVVSLAAADCGRRLPSPEEVSVRAKLKTVRDVVAFLECCPRALD